MPKPNTWNPIMGKTCTLYVHFLAYWSMLKCFFFINEILCHRLLILWNAANLVAVQFVFLPVIELCYLQTFVSSDHNMSWGRLINKPQQIDWRQEFRKWMSCVREYYSGFIYHPYKYIHQCHLGRNTFGKNLNLETKILRERPKHPSTSHAHACIKDSYI